MENNAIKPLIGLEKDYHLKMLLHGCLLICYYYKIVNIIINSHKIVTVIKLTLVCYKV